MPDRIATALPLARMALAFGSRSAVLAKRSQAERGEAFTVAMPVTSPDPISAKSHGCHLYSVRM